MPVRKTTYKHLFVWLLVFILWVIIGMCAFAQSKKTTFARNGANDEISNYEKCFEHLTKRRFVRLKLIGADENGSDCLKHLNYTPKKNKKNKSV